MQMKTLVLELGGWKIRYKLHQPGSRDKEGEVLNIVGRVKKTMVTGEKLRKFPTYVSSRPIQRGLVLDWELEKRILVSEIFAPLNILDALSDFRVVVAVSNSIAANEALRTELLTVFFEDFRFNQVVILNSSLCSQFSPTIFNQFSKDDWENPCGLLVDLGFSGLRVIPVLNTIPIPKSQVRIDLGARCMNNFLKEILAFGPVDLDDNPLLVERIRELATLVASSTEVPNPIRLRLPDYTDHYEPEVVELAGIRPEGITEVDLLRERSIVAEALFSPAICGVNQCGISEAAEIAVSRCPDILRHLIVRKIILTGGIAKTPGLLVRFAQELRASLPVEWRGFRVITDDAPDVTNFRGAVALSENEQDLENIGIFTRQMFFGR